MEPDRSQGTRQPNVFEWASVIPWVEFFVLLLIVTSFISLYVLIVPEEAHNLSLGSIMVQAFLLSLCVVHGCVTAFLSHLSRRSKIIRTLCVFLAILFIVGVTTFTRISIRATINSSAIHDSAIQTEAAYDALVSGKNPYLFSYADVFPLGTWNPIILNGRWIPNPAIDHYIYLPGQIVIEGAAGAAEQAAFGFRDARILTLLVVFALTATIAWLLRRNPLMPSALLLFAANPALLYVLVDGRNDFIILGLLCFAFLALQSKKFFVAALLFGLACATKQFAFFCLPFVFIFLWKKYGWRSRETVRFVAVILGIIAFAIIPFLAWNAPAFIDDVVRFPSGSATGGQLPMNGYGFSRLVTAFGVSDMAYFPFWIFMALAALPLSVFFGRAIYKNPSIPLVIAASMLTLFSALLFSRFLQQNYVIFIMQAISWALVLLLSRHDEQSVLKV